MCDEQGNCEQVQDGSGGSASGTDETSSQDDAAWSYEGGESFEDCVLEAGGYCRDQCDHERGYDAVECVRDCVEDLEGQCEEYDSDLGDYAGDGGECSECVDLCEDACDRFRQDWRRDNCLSECRSRCDAVCN